MRLERYLDRYDDANNHASLAQDKRVLIEIDCKTLCWNTMRKFIRVFRDDFVHVSNRYFTLISSNVFEMVKNDG